jgi:chromosome segregation protein
VHSTSLQEQAHAIQVETLKLAQALDRFRERRRRSTPAWPSWLAEEESENERVFIADEAIETQREEIRELQLLMDGGTGTLRAGRAGLARRARTGQCRVERELREAQFSQRECRGKIEEIAAVASWRQADDPHRRRTGALRGKCR